jgi:hypothetical protein
MRVIVARSNFFYTIQSVKSNPRAKRHTEYGIDLKGLTARIADSSSINAASFSSARTTKRFPSSRSASAIQIVRPFELTVATQPQLHPALLRLSAIISQYFTFRTPIFSAIS